MITVVTTDVRFIEIPAYVITPHASIRSGVTGTRNWFRMEAQRALIAPNINFSIMFCHSYHLNRLVPGL
jgi:hypothetical protein